MAAFADMHGEPDAETTARMRERLRTTLADGQTRKAKVRHWIQASLLTALVLAGSGYAAMRAGWLGTPDTVTERGVIQTTTKAQELAVGWGVLRLDPNTVVRVESEPRVVELVEGTVDIRIDDENATEVRVGAYTASGTGTHFEIRRTPGIPLVTVHDGELVLYGPDLPETGVAIRSPTPDRNVR